MARYRRLFVYFAVLSLIFCLAAGCSRKREKSENERKSAQSNTSDRSEAASEESKITEENSAEKTTDEEKDTLIKEKKQVTIYFIDDASAEVIGEGFEIEDEYDIWNVLQKQKVLTEGCKLLSIKVNKEKKQINLDFNKATGEYIRTMGTAGETAVIGCIVNTYLEAYDCTEIKLTEGGEVFQTAHGADFEGYIGRINDL